MRTTMQSLSVAATTDRSSRATSAKPFSKPSLLKSTLYWAARPAPRTGQ